MHVDPGRCVVTFLLWCVSLPAVAGKSARSKDVVKNSAKNTTRGERWNKDHFLSEDIQVGCRELRAKRYISDGFCTSMKPIKEVVCAGNCLPIRDLPWYAEFVKYWSRNKLREFQCEEDFVKRKKVRLLCQNGKYRTYKIKVVKSCKCKRTIDDHNRTKRRDRRRRRRKGQKRRKHTSKVPRP